MVCGLSNIMDTVNTKDMFKRPKIKTKHLYGKRILDREKHMRKVQGYEGE